MWLEGFLLRTPWCACVHGGVPVWCVCTCGVSAYEFDMCVSVCIYVYACVGVSGLYMCVCCVSTCGVCTCVILCAYTYGVRM